MKTTKEIMQKRKSIELLMMTKADTLTAEEKEYLRMWIDVLEWVMKNGNEKNEKIRNQF